MDVPETHPPGPAAQSAVARRFRPGTRAANCAGMTLRTLVPLVLGAGLFGCVGTLTPVDGVGDDTGGDDGGGGGGGAAEIQFNNQVSPLLNAACANCHAGAAGSTPLKFLGNAGTTGYYDAVTIESAVIGDFTPTCALVLKGLHDGGNARAWTDAEKATITSWLSAESAARGL